MQMTTSKLVDYCLEHPEILREPICIDDKHLLVGYNGNEIQQFLPRIVRRAEL
ncbi:hypothetical protein GHI93_00290 [Lactococcus hircilactis]|uniref:Uncharacterized protein n=1 Tax=Lactococcus hircilactis TaxID=1494462 RepID=A0A7X1Z744_9LACT|nr:ArsC/Spx/MgsR family protein [Lactococcus hircilactis]MQW38389.1 hypothetical protein [Lactococcus hircilactis]